MRADETGPLSRPISFIRFLVCARLHPNDICHIFGDLGYGPHVMKMAYDMAIQDICQRAEDGCFVRGVVGTRRKQT
jgi:hypothetical protein